MIPKEIRESVKLINTNLESCKSVLLSMIANSILFDVNLKINYLMVSSSKFICQGDAKETRNKIIDEIIKNLTDLKEK
jgi:hypothetical protein